MHSGKARKFRNPIAVTRADPRFPRFLSGTVCMLVVCAALFIALPTALNASSESCHIHPPGWESKEPEPRGLEVYASLQECESANARYYGGRGRCHCIPDIFTNPERRDFWFAPPEYFGPPRQERP